MHIICTHPACRLPSFLLVFIALDDIPDILKGLFVLAVALGSVQCRHSSCPSPTSSPAC
jgi:hypothetical protein